MIRLSAPELDTHHGASFAARLRGAVVSIQQDYPAAFPTTNEDALLLLTASSAVSEVARLWLAAGKHVLLAAELVTSCEELAQLSQAARASGTQLWCINVDRYLPSRQLIREQLDKGHLGEVGLIRSHRWTERAPSGSQDAIGLPPVLTRDLDLALWYAGRLPSRAYAVSRGDYVNIHLGFAGGAMALLDFARRTPQGRGYQSLSVIGASGAAYADDHQNMQLAFDAVRGAPRAVQTSEGIRPLVVLVQAFVDSLAAGRDLSASVAEWHTVLKVQDALERSLASGQAVALEGC